jgi:cytochrome P450 family 142 subfamily A polypeptide 1
MINFDAPEHTKRRRLVGNGFTPRRVADHEPFLRNKVNELIDSVIDKGSCDFVADIATPLPMLMIGELMGLPESDYEQLLHWSDLFATGGEEIRAEVEHAVFAWNEYIMAKVHERRGGDGDDSILGTSAAVFGAGEKDTLTGDGGKDTFILGVMFDFLLFYRYFHFVYFLKTQYIGQNLPF